MESLFDSVAQLASMDKEMNPELLSILLLNRLPSSFEVFTSAIEPRDMILVLLEVLQKIFLVEFDVRNQRQKKTRSLVGYS